MIYLALLPAVLLCVWIYRQDRVEKEPISLLIKIFILGVISTIPTVIAEVIFSDLLELFLEPNTVLFLALENFFGVALIEEYFKMKAASTGAWKNPNFDHHFDAIVYCTISALGFAAFENIFYLIDADLETALLRGTLSVPSHAIDGMIMGYFFGLAKQKEKSGDRKGMKKYRRLAVLIPAIEHGIYDFALSLESGIVLIAFLIFVIGVDVWAFRFVKNQSRKDRMILQEMRNE